MTKYLNKQMQIRNRLYALARQKDGPLIYFYSVFGPMVGIFDNMRSAKDMLDAIAAEERHQKRPDLTYMLVNKKWLYPSQIDGQLALPPTARQRQLAYEEMVKIIKEYRGGMGRNPWRPVI
ncbi:hypothetical protein HJB77_03325 [Rhizobium lentis]|uniref:hypothetical protein n=1 Tax=Rhizobium lentis TaxID=1138194 RepID=UPI001C82873E|nr:hypothetical protein [Rhizobium lentis]MBX5175327.1 hypothetical protein [Rhizobium lentis]